MPNNSQPPRWQSLWRGIIAFGRRRSTIGAGVILLSFGAMGYIGIRYLVYRKLPGWLEIQLETILQREVEVGNVSGFSYSSIQFDVIALPASTQDNYQLVMPDISAHLNWWSLLRQRTIQIDFHLPAPQARLTQEADGTWLDINLGDFNPPLDLDLGFIITQGTLALVPHHNPNKNLQLQAQGSSRYQVSDERRVIYDFTAAIAQSQLALSGETALPDGKTRVAVDIQRLSLPDIMALFADFPIALSRGDLDSDLTLTWPAFEKLEATESQGKVGIADIVAEVPPLESPLKAEVALQIEGQTLKIETLNLWLDQLHTQVTGSIDWKRGYDLSAQVKPFALKPFTEPAGVPIQGQLQGQFQVKGPLDQPQFTGSWRNVRPIRFDQFAIKQLQGKFQITDQQIVLPELLVVPVVGGTVKGNGAIALNWQDLLDQPWQKLFAKTQLAFELTADLPIPELVRPYYAFPDTVAIANLTAQGKLRGTLAQPIGLLQWQLPALSVPKTLTLAGSGQLVWEDQQIALRNTQLQSDQGRLQLDGNADFKTQNWQTNLSAQHWDLSPFLPASQHLPQAIALTQAQSSLSGRLDQLSLQQLQGQADVGLTLDGTEIQLTSQWNDGQLRAMANLSRVDLNQWVPNLSLPVAITSAQAQAAGPINQLLTLLSEQPQLNQFQAQAEVDLAFASGQVKTQTNLQADQWSTQIDAAGMNLVQFLEAVPQPLYIPWFRLQREALDPIFSASLSLSGNLNRDVSEIYTIKAHQAQIRSGEEQWFTANGEMDITALFSAPQLARIELNFDARTNFETLRLDSLTANLPSSLDQVTSPLQLKGQSHFSGEIVGLQLQHPNPDNRRFWFRGQLHLKDFFINGYAFESEMQGEVRLEPAKIIAVDLRGQHDVIAVALEPCPLEACDLPFWPQNFELRLGQPSADSLVAIGNRRGDRFGLTLEPFELGVLGLTPVRQWGIPNPLQGQVQAELDWNLAQSRGEGTFQMDDIDLGNLQIEQLTSAIALDLPQATIEVQQTQVQLADTQATLQGQFNWRSGAIAADLAVPQGQIGDLFDLWPWSTFGDYIAFRQTQQFASAAALEETAITSSDASIKSQLSLFGQIEAALLKLGDQRRAGGIPQRLELTGPYQAQIQVDGTIQEPELQFSLVGERWAWEPYPPFPSIIESLGLTIERAQVVPLEQVIVQGRYGNQVVTFDQANLVLGNTTLSLEGDLSPQHNDVNFAIDNLSFDVIYYFALLPLDLTGTINAQGQFQGSWAEPQLIAEMSLADLGINDRFLSNTLVGDLTYADEKFSFQTRESDGINFSARVPYPIQPNINDRLELELQLAANQATQLEGDLPGGWQMSTGSGEVDIKISGKLDPADWLAAKNWQAQGHLQLADTTFTHPALVRPLVLNGDINLIDDRIQVDNLLGQVPGTGLEIAVQGILPILRTSTGQPNAQSEMLTLAITPSDITLDKLYEGSLASEVTLQGSLIRPQIGGWMQLGKGRLSFPQNLAQQLRDRPEKTSWLATDEEDSEPTFKPQLDDLRLIFDDFTLAKTKRLPTFAFRLSGDLLLNGALDNIGNIQPEGTIQISRGSTNIFTTKVYFGRQHDNLLTFYPELGLLNPQLDLQLQFYLFSVSLQTITDNEVPDDIVRSGRTKTVEINVDVEGFLSQIFPSLGQNLETICQLSPPGLSPIVDDVNHNLETLSNLEKCIQVNALEKQLEQRLLFSPVISISSNPPLSRTEIIALLGPDSPQLIENLQEQNSAQLINIGFPQVAVILIPGLQDVIFELNNAVTDLASAIGIENLTAYPALNITFPIDDSSSVRATYDYIFNEGIIEYQLRF